LTIILVIAAVTAASLTLLLLLLLLVTLATDADNDDVVVVDVMGGGFKIRTNLGIVFMDDNDSDDVNDAGIDACNDNTTLSMNSNSLLL
jgi:hypothetical protein